MEFAWPSRVKGLDLVDHLPLVEPIRPAFAGAWHSRWWLLRPVLKLPETPRSRDHSLLTNGLIGGERARPDPEIGEGVEIFLVSAGDGVFLSALDSQAVFSRRKRPDFFYQQDVHEHRSVNANESVGFERFCHDRNRLT
jgi:hypothetical protein